MGLLPNKSGLIIGSLIGSALGLLFAKSSGKDLRSRLLAAGTPQKKFEVLFQEYLRAGKDVLTELEDNDAYREIIAGGKDILVELKKRAKTDGTAAVRYAADKAADLIKDTEELIAQAEKATKKTSSRTGARAAKAVVKGVVKGAYRAGKVVQATEDTADRAKRVVRRTAKGATKTVRRATRS